MAFPFFTIVSILLHTSFFVYWSFLLSFLEMYTFRRVVDIASFYFLLIILLLNSLRMSAQMSMSFLGPPSPTLLLVLFLSPPLPHSLLRLPTTNIAPSIAITVAITRATIVTVMFTVPQAHSDGHVMKREV